MANTWKHSKQPPIKADYNGDDAMTLTAEEIYRRLHDGPGTGNLYSSYDGQRLLQGRYSRRGKQIAELKRDMDAAWQGSAASAAGSRMRPLTETFSQSEELLNTTRELTDSQGRWFQHTRQQVQPLPERTGTSSVAGDVEMTVAEYRRKATANIDAYDSYFAATSANGASMPKAYPAPAPPQGSISVTVPGDHAGGAGWSPMPAAGGTAAAGGGGAGVPGSPGGAADRAGGARTPGATPVSGAGGGPGGSVVDPGPESRAGVGQPGGTGSARSGGSSGPSGGSGDPEIGRPGGSGGPGGAGGPLGGSGGPSIGRLGGSGGPEIGRPGGLGGRIGGLGGPPGRLGEPGRPGGLIGMGDPDADAGRQGGAVPGGQRAGAAFGPHGPEHAARGSAGGARLGAVNLPDGLAGGGGRHVEEDEEHTRKTWLEEPDPDELFGTDQRTVRPVIGEE